MGRHFPSGSVSVQCRWLSAGTGHPEGPRGLHHQRSPNPPGLGAGWPCWSRVAPGDTRRSLPTPAAPRAPAAPPLSGPAQAAAAAGGCSKQRAAATLLPAASFQGQLLSLILPGAGSCHPACANAPTSPLDSVQSFLYWEPALALVAGPALVLPALTPPPQLSPRAIAARPGCEKDSSITQLCAAGSTPVAGVRRV